MRRARRVLFVDASRGASGDMILGALVDIGVPVARLRAALSSLQIEGWTLRSRRVERSGIAARKIDVRVRGDQPGRGWKALRRILDGGELTAPVRRRALAIFRRLIEAEAEAHGRTPETVHLHEAGGTDAIVDVVGCAFGLDYLALDRIVVSPMTTGFGRVACEHGDYPVPGPATLALVRGCPVQSGDIAIERLTPTGAAVLTSVADEWGELPAMRPIEIGYGAGDHDLGRTPNLLRVVLGESAVDDPSVGPRGEVIVLECTVDDATPQTLAHASGLLLEAGALDVMTAPVTMKKGRAGHHLTVLGRPEDGERLTRILLAETGSLGLRYRIERRVELERETRKVRTPFGTLRIKLGFQDDGRIHAWPEYDDCARLARKSGVTLVEVQRAALAAVESKSRGPARRKSAKKKTKR